MKKIDLIIFDLDGTLADIDHRLQFIEKKPKDWPSFFSACSFDKPIWPNILLAQRLMASQYVSVHIWTGRNEDVRKTTEVWLWQYELRHYDELKMRKSGDRRLDHIVKSEWLDKLPKGEWPDIVFEDRDSVVNMWRSKGITCYQVAPGDF